MSFDKALRLTSILLASAAFIGLSLGASLPEGLLLLTGLTLILTLLRTLGLHSVGQFVNQITLSTTAWNALIIVAFAGFWIDLLWISGELLPSGVHFLLLLMVIKLFNLESRRDYLHLYAISLMAILASAASTTDLWYLPVFLAYLLTGVWTLVLYQLTRESEDAVPGGRSTSSVDSPSARATRITPQLFWLANGLAFGTLLFTVMIFFTIPRVSAGFGHMSSGETLRTSGFSETVNLGVIGPIKRDPGIVMRVELADRPRNSTDHLYLRGMAYDHYDGRSWATQLTQRSALTEASPGIFAVPSSLPRSATQSGDVIRQTILLEVLDTAVLFAAPFPESVSGEFFSVQSDPTAALYVPVPPSSRTEYTVLSRQHAVLPADLQPQPVAYSASFARHYLQVPGSSDRVAALAQEVTQAKASAYEKALAIQDHLSGHFRYSLDIPASSQERPLEEFLFSRKTGYCEHYATAMVVMLRSVGVPARLVTGFLATEWNQYGNYYLVRQRDAHAWVEVYLPRSGWVTMDPTPAVIESGTDPGWQAFSRVMDSVRLRWNRFFVQYSGADQVAVVRGLKDGTAAVRYHAWNSLSSLLAPVGDLLGRMVHSAREGNIQLVLEFLGLVVVGVVAVIGLIRVWPWGRKGRSEHASPDRALIAHIYDGAIKQIARYGIAKSPAATPLEFLQSVKRQWAQAGELMATVTDLYCRGRFGQVALTTEELDRARQSLRQLARLDPPVA